MNTDEFKRGLNILGMLEQTCKTHTCCNSPCPFCALLAQDHQFRQNMGLSAVPHNTDALLSRLELAASTVTFNLQSLLNDFVNLLRHNDELQKHVEQEQSEHENPYEQGDTDG